MASRIKPSSSSRYNNKSPSSSTDTLFHNNPISNSSSSKAIIKTRTAAATNANNFGSMVKKFMETRSGSAHSSRKPNKGFANEPLKLTVAADFLAEDLKKTGLSGTKKATPLGALHKKLFKGGGKKENEERKALTEVKGNNTRTLAMVLRSERELLNLTKDQESQISELKLLLDDKDREVEKLKDLCLKQREEIQSLKSAVLFPDMMNSHVQELLEKQGSELKQAKLLIPNLQKQVSSLTGQLQCLADDLAEVKADKYSLRGCSFDNHSSPRTPPTYEQDEATNSLEFSSGDQTTPGSPDDLFIKDLNPCLTPYYTTKSKGFEESDFLDDDEGLFGRNSQTGHQQFGLTSCSRKLSKSSNCRQCPSSASSCSSVHAARRSDESRINYARPTCHRHF
ncbi:OLC1v1021132C1 [Oldenlandia corymbosa var. corymbosa]|uniref:OLC1v1021132C1 n=1 Tax=Oldenlandia corymbosa var. corymbosa TaxID=529605 RepID=A0AAV1BW69_OLDCO|nr:OLC1v1021132C1 [Oldenlandia corymbosa var. corymbosa]